MTPAWPRGIRGAVAALVVAWLLGGCSAGMQIHDDGMRRLAEGDRDAGLAQLREATRIDPTNARYRIDYLREQLLFARDLLERADDARRMGRADDAVALYQQALRVQPGNERAMRGLSLLQMDARHAQMVADAERAQREGAVDTARKTVQAILAENPSNEAGLRLSMRIAELQARQDEAKAAQALAQSIMRKPVTLQFRDANLRMVFEALSRTTGLNVILDRDVRADLKTTIFVKDATVEDTVDLILLQNQLDKRLINASTLFVYPSTPAKQKEYQDLVVRTFQIANSDAKYLQTVLKSLLKVKDIAIDERANTLAIRDTPEAVAVAAKVVAAHDVPEPEVMLEVEVLEIARTRASNIGLLLPTSFTVATPTAANTIGALRDLTRRDLTATGLSVTANLQLQDSDINLLASPRIRARNKEKAKILIGDRVPTITNTVTPIQTGGSVVTGTVQYQDVGLKLEFESQVYNSQEVGIKLNLEVSNITDTFTDPQGGRSYQIGTRNAQTSLRLRDGETQILGGLISDLDRYTAAKVAGLGHLPVVGALFGNNDNTRTKTEIVLSITPRIVRPPANIDAALREIFSGTENSVRERPLRVDPIGEMRAPSSRPGSATPGSATPVTPAPAPAPAPAAPVAPAVGPAAAPAAAPTQGAAASAAATQAAPDAPSAPATLPAPDNPPSATPAGAPAAPRPDLSLLGPATVRLGETFTATVSASALPALKSVPLTVRFDPSVLRFEGAQLGDLAERAQAAPASPRVDPRTGRIDALLSFDNPEGGRGDGALLELKFAVHSGRATTQLIAAQTSAETASGDRVALPGPRNLQLRITP